MNSVAISRLLNHAGFAVKKHLPAIFAGFGLVSMVGGTVLAVKKTPEAMRKIEERKEELGVDELAPREAIRVAWRCYIPTVSLTVAGLGLVIASNVMNAKRGAALVTACTMAERALHDYRNEVMETFGGEQAGTVRDKIAKRKLENKPVENEKVIETSNGDDLFYDAYSGRYFRTSKVKLDAAVNFANSVLIDKGYLALNDFYDILGLDPVKSGEDLGWNICKGLIELDLSTQFATDGSPCGVLDYMVSPIYDFDKWL